MARKLLTDWPVCRAIIDGEYDEDLRQIEAAISYRRKAMDRVVGAKIGSRFTVTAEGSSAYGRVGTITKVNPKRYVVHFDGDEDYREFTCPKTMGTVEAGTPQERAEALRTICRDARGVYDFTLSAARSNG